MMRAVTTLAAALSLALAGCRSPSSDGPSGRQDAGRQPSRAARCDACADTSCDADAAEACFELGVAHETGDGAPQDLARARALWDRAARAGHAGARAKIRARWGGI